MRRCRDKHCVGILGHDCPHWRYDEDGSLHQWRSCKGLKKWDWASSMTPPDHKKYIHPKNKWNLVKRVASVREHFKYSLKEQEKEL